MKGLPPPLLRIMKRRGRRYPVKTAVNPVISLKNNKSTITIHFLDTNPTLRLQHLYGVISESLVLDKAKSTDNPPNNKKNFWSKWREIRRYFDWFADSNSIESQKQWYSFTLTEVLVRTHRSPFLMDMFKSSLLNALEIAYPGIHSFNLTTCCEFSLKFHHVKLLINVHTEYEWDGWKFSIVPNGFWHDVRNQRKYFEWLAKELEITEQKNWYTISRKYVLEERGASMLVLRYNGSLIRALQTSYPEFIWYPWLFEKCPKDWWSSWKNQRRFLEWLGEDCGFLSIDDFYRVSLQDIRDRGGLRLLARYGTSIIRTIKGVFPEHTWHPWLFTMTPKETWMSARNRRNYFDWLADKLGMETMEEFYHLKWESVEATGGGGMVNTYYNGVLSDAILDSFPECSLVSWMFERIPMGFWKDHSNITKYMDWVREKLNITEREEWARVTASQFDNLGGSWLMRQNGFVGLLQKAYPDENWEADEFVYTFGEAKIQQHLEKTIADVFTVDIPQMRVNKVIAT